MATAPPPHTAHVLVVAAELMAATRVEALLTPLGCALEFAPLDPPAIEGFLAAGGWDALVLDLGAPAGAREAAMSGARTAGVPVVAFGSHIEGAVLQAARAAGAAAVLTRGEMAHALPVVVAKQIASRT